MHSPDRPIETGLALLRDLVAEDPRLEDEFAATRSLFQQGQTAERSDAERSASNRRHLEWFLLERPSTALGGVPVEVLREELIERADEDGERLAAILLSSQAGAFEVGSVDPGQGIWVSDLFSGGHQPLEEPPHIGDVRPGDLFVGRVYRIEPRAGGRDGGDASGLLRLSTAAARFRNDTLVRALRQDVERSRASRRGVLRIQQIELERLFFSDPDGSDAPVAATVAPFSPLAAARDGLRAIGLPEPDVVAALAALRDAAVRTPERSDVVTGILNTWAFDTEIDLGEGQRILAGLWKALVHAEATRATAPAAPQADVPAAPAADEIENEERARRRAALGKFDSGRAAGESMDALFARLERDLGLAEEHEVDPGDATPDFPGVVSAMIEEYLWDARRTGAPRDLTERDARALRPFAHYGGEIGVFENLGLRELVDYCGRWLLDERALGDAEHAREAIEALGRFCRWTEEQHGHPLWTPFAEAWEALLEDVPRLFGVRAACSQRADAAPFEIESIEGDALRVRSFNDDPIDRVRLDASLAKGLRPGDIVHLAAGADAEARLVACYPAALRTLLEAHAQNADQGS